ncbi:hypothetical protein J6590_054692 [Homalodisca vitripennis]|nr:hypothetical protein J6590_054692 [Homalodisca vitripennis]
MATKKSFISMIQNSKLLTANLFKDEPTMVPSHLMPKMQLVHINVPERITPGKVKKQSDIRQALMAKLNETEEAEESPFLLPEQEALVKEELNTLKVNFNSLSFTESKYLYHRINDANMGSEELFNLEFTQQSEFTDWNRVLQQTYLVSHSSDSEILCHLLDKAESMQLGEHKDLNSQVDYSSIVTNKKRVSKTKTKRVPENPIKKKKTDKEEKHGMDIRECMAIAADKARLTQDKCGVKDDSVIISESLIDQTVVISPQETIVQDKEHGDSVECASCNHTFGGIAKELQKFLPPIQNFSFNFNLSRMEIFVKSLTKEVITRFNVSETLRQDTDFTVEDINRNIMALKASNNVNITTKQESSDLFDVNDIFETEFQTPPKTLLPKSNLINHSLNKINSLARTPSKILVKPLLSQQSQDYFNLDDIFAGDDDEDIQHWVKCSKTSTPIQKITPVFDLESKKDGFEKGVFEERVQNPNKLKANTSMCLFKVPQMKLDPQTLNNLHDISKSSEVQLSPQSPVLSGQLVPPKISLTSVSAQGCRNSFFQSPESPILTGQLTLSSKMSSARREERKPLFCDSPESPILSSQILRNKSSPVNKAGRKVLFSENHVNKQKGDITKSTWCKPLYNNLNEMETNDVCTEIEGDDMLSASQLFDDEDSGEGNTKSNLDQSSMYTISQMVAKVTELARNPLVHESTAHKSTKDAKTPQKVDNKFGSSDEDSLFENINLDDLSVRNNNADTKKDVSNTEKILSNNMRNSGNVSYNCSTVNVNNKNFKENSNAETTLYKNNQLHNSINRSNSIISNQQNSALTNFEEVNEVCEESSITTRWLSCMKSPFQPHTIKTSTPHVQVNKKTNFDSDSDSHDDVFQSPLQKMKNRPPVNIEKNTRKEKKRQLFVEMEADVTGPPQSSDEENTSGLDDLDDSFINDMTEQPCTSVDHTVLDMQARYLQSVKSPVRKPGGFKIPKVSDSVLAQDVFSQFVEEEEDSYLNDSFCCDATEIPVDEEPSVLEMAEYILNQDRKSRKVKKTKRKRTKFNSSSDDNEIDQEQKEKWLLSSESSDEDQVVKNCKTRKRKQCVNSESSPSDQSLETKKPFKRKRIHLLTSDSDSDRTL